jgi:hypothetical protein
VSRSGAGERAGSLPSAWSRVPQTLHLYQRLVCHEAAAWLPVAYLPQIESSSEAEAPQDELKYGG